MTNLTPADALASGLAEIELLIERGNLAAAQTVAQQLLLQQPNSAAVHAALGDIAGARHLHREAIEWYELALRLGPTLAVRESLARQREMLDEERVGAAPPQPLRDKRLLIIGGAIVGAILLVLAIVLIVGAGRNYHAAQYGRPAQVGGRPADRATTGEVTPPATPEVRPTTRPGAGPYGTGLGSGAVASAPVTPPGGLRVTQSVDAPMTDRDVLLTRALAGLSWSNGEALNWRVMGVMDPFTGYALITVELPPAMRTGSLYVPVVNMAYQLATATVHADRGVESLTVRVLTQVENEKGRKVELVAFRGNTTREALDYYLKRGLQPDPDTIWGHIFATTWWNPSVPAGNTTPAAGAAIPEPTPAPAAAPAQPTTGKY